MVDSLQSWKGHPLGPPIVVHCSAGIRTIYISVNLSNITINQHNLCMKLNLVSSYIIYLLTYYLGIGRTGTFCTLDIAIRKFEDTEKVDIKRTGI